MARAAELISSEPHTRPQQPAIRSTIERETKLTVDEHFRLPHLPGTTPLPPRVLTATYYDTERYDLAHAGITLRRRMEQGVRKWQLKIPVIEDRQEIEIVDHNPTPPDAFYELLRVHVSQQPLMPVATLRTRRTGVRVHGEHGPIADVTVDHVSVVKQDEVSQRFCEVEIEQLDGEDTSLRDLSRELRRAGAEDHDGRPKLLRALSLPDIDTEARPGADAPVIEHVRAAIARHVRWLMAHDPGTRLGRESECLHQMRVATRQLRAVLHAAAPVLAAGWTKSLQKELTWLNQALGPARDLDVQLVYVRNEAATLDPADSRPLIRFIDHLESQRAAVQDKLLGELNGPRYLGLVRRLRTAAQGPAFVPSTVGLTDLAAREFKKLRKAIRRGEASLNNMAVHDIRIKTKRARYAAELAQPAVGRPAERFIKQARLLSDLLGTHQDALQAEAHVRAFLNHSTNLRAAFVAGRMVERQRERRKQARKAMRAQWKRLMKRGRQAWNP